MLHGSDTLLARFDLERVGREAHERSVDAQNGIDRRGADRGALTRVLEAREKRVWFLAVVAALVLSLGPIVTPYAVSADAIVHGLGFSPYIDGQGPPDPVSEQQIRDRLGIVASYPRWIRTWGMRSGLERIPAVAQSPAPGGFGLQVAACAFVNGDPHNDEIQKANLIAAADHVDIAIVGNEALVNGLLTKEGLIAHLIDVRQRLDDAGFAPEDEKFIPVTTAEPFGNWANDQPGGLFHREGGILVNGEVLQHLDLLFVHLYPFHEGAHIGDAIDELDDLLHSTRLAVDEIAPGLPIVIGETGWPSAGDTNGAAEPTLANAKRYFHEVIAWAAEKGQDLFYFEAFDENWKPPGYANVERHWGLHYANGIPKFPIPSPACDDGIDNDGDDLIDLADPDCTDRNDPLEAPDADEDLVEDSLDNCVQVANPVQEDTDGDDFGNGCDCDFDQSLTCGISDFNLFLPDFQSTVDSGVGCDMDSNGTVGIADFNLFLPGFVAGEPGPSGLVP